MAERQIDLKELTTWLTYTEKWMGIPKGEALDFLTKFASKPEEVAPLPQTEMFNKGQPQPQSEMFKETPPKPRRVFASPSDWFERLRPGQQFVIPEMCDALGWTMRIGRSAMHMYANMILSHPFMERVFQPGGGVAQRTLNGHSYAIFRRKMPEGVGFTMAAE